MGGGDAACGQASMTPRRGARSVARGARRAKGSSRAPRTAHREPVLAARTADRAPGAVEQQLAHIERDGGDGDVRFDDGRTLRVSSLDKLYFPRDGITKGGLMRYYAHVAPVLLPILADRPLGL